MGAKKGDRKESAGIILGSSMNARLYTVGLFKNSAAGMVDGRLGFSLFGNFGLVLENYRDFQRVPGNLTCQSRIPIWLFFFFNLLECTAKWNLLNRNLLSFLNVWNL